MELNRDRDHRAPLSQITGIVMHGDVARVYCADAVAARAPRAPLHRATVSQIAIREFSPVTTATAMFVRSCASLAASMGLLDCRDLHGPDLWLRGEG